MTRIFSIIIFFLLAVSSAGAQQLCEGRVLDSITKEPLPFVNIKFGNTNQGATSNIDGFYKFYLPDGASQVQFSFIGYNKKVLTANQLKTKKTIYLNQLSKELIEFTVLPGENPAHRIIRLANQNSKTNNHELKNYTCKNYNKFVFTADIDSLMLADTTRWDGLDSSQIKLNQFISNQHFLLIENYVERTHAIGGKVKENVIASRTSGLKETSLPLLASQLQSFTFYEDYIMLMDKRFLNPLATGSISRYNFYLTDTIFHQKDTIFLISFAPKPSKNFDGLDGVLYINTNGYAIENVLAKGKIESSGLEIEIKQRYQKHSDGNWFPVELTTRLLFSNFKIGDKNMMGYGKTYITEVDFPEKIKKSKLGAFELEIAKNAHKTSDSLWENYRTINLDNRDSLTYKVIDSLGDKAKLDRRVTFASSLSEGRLPIKNLFEIDLGQLLWYNPYEGTRVGLGLYTGKRIIPWMSAGGYLAYGFKDKAWKHGVDATFFLYKKRDVRLFTTYKNDVVKAGYQEFPGRKIFNSTELYKNLFANLYDKKEKWEVSASGRIHPSLFVHVGAANQNRETAYEYLFARLPDDASAQTYNRYTFSELSFTLNYVHKQRLTQAFDLVLPSKPRYPQFWINFRKGVPNLLGGTLNYIKIEALAEVARFTRNLGRTGVVFRGGWTDANLPLGLLFNGYGVDGRWALSVQNAFETSRPNEFIHDRYAAFFFTHNFGSLLFRYKKFEPQIELAFNGGLGTMISPQSHRLIDFNQMEQGYYETGIRLNNLIKSSFTSMGVAAFYRLGPYSLPSTRNNFAFKLSLVNSF
ncbi:MAG: DUF5686 family protein [Flavobacteriales bacterium]